jgi:hypothetical protein
MTAVVGNAAGSSADLVMTPTDNPAGQNRAAQS